MAKYKLSLFLTIVAISIIGCKNTNTRTATDEENKKIVDSISYVKDRDMGLCFATIKSLSFSGHEIISIANVPCDRIR
jgi:hypothetical protein